MRILPALVLSAAAVAQGNSLTTTFASNNGQSGNMFDVSVIAPVAITDFDLNLDAGTWDIEVYRPTAGGPYAPVGSTAAAWTLVDSIPGVVSNGINTATPLGLTVPIAIQPGQNEGIYITVSNGAAMNYTNGSATGAAYASDTIMTIYEGAGKSYPFGSNFNPRVWNGTIHYAPGGSGGTIALNTAIGAGCGGGAPGDGSAYELFDTGNPFDLASTSHQYLWIGDGYIVIDNPIGAIVPPTGAGALSLGDDQVVPITLPWQVPSPTGLSDEVYLCSNGFLAFEPGATADWTESVAEFLANESRICFLWDDLNPSAGGTVDAEVDPGNPNLFHVTFTDVPQFATTDQNTVQLSISSTGDLTVTYGNVASADSLVGVTSGNGATDPGPSSYSGLPTTPIGPFVTGFDVPNLTLTAITRPVIGTTWDLEVGNVRQGAAFGVPIFGVADPGVPDLGFLGMPGCGLFASLDVLGGPVPLGPGQTVFAYGLDLSGVGPNLVGFQIYTQGAVFGNGINSFDAVTSSGVRGDLGDL